MKYRIEKGIPIPDAHPGGKQKFPWDKYIPVKAPVRTSPLSDLQVSESFFVPNVREWRYAAVYQTRHPKKQFLTRQAKKGKALGVRVWRTK